jgi:hypothetical protein
MAFALDDIGTLIFVEILQIHQYPGDPFTGNIIRDLIMHLFLPSVLIIMFIYAILGFINLGHTKLKLLMGIAMYLFVVAGGYFSFFALLSDFYFIFLIFIVGAIYFLPSHFGRGREGPHSMPGSAVAESHAQAATSLLNAIRVQCGVVEATKSGPDQRLLPTELRELGKLLTDFNGLKTSMKFNPGERARYMSLLAAYGVDENKIIKEAKDILQRH